MLVMGEFGKKLKHAFAVDPPGVAEPSEAQKRAVDYLCAAIVRRRMTVPAITLLEMSRPLNFMFASAMHVAEPAASVLTRLVRMLAAKPVGGLGLEDESEKLRTEDWTAIAQFFEKRGSFDYVLRKIEEIEESQEVSKGAREQCSEGKESQEGCEGVDVEEEPQEGDGTIGG